MVNVLVNCGVTGEQGVFVGAPEERGAWFPSAGGSAGCVRVVRALGSYSSHLACAGVLLKSRGKARSNSTATALSVSPVLHEYRWLECAVHQPCVQVGFGADAFTRDDSESRLQEETMS